jgi:hypothetical protein
MESKDLIRLNLERSGNRVLKTYEGLKEHGLTFPTAKGGCHAIWTLGHLAFTEYSLVKGRMLGEENPLEGWADLFENGSQAVAEPGLYPSFEELHGKCRAARDETISLLETLDEPDLDTVSRNVPEHLAKTFGTYRLCFQFTADHWYMHQGHASDIKRAAGLLKSQKS